MVAVSVVGAWSGCASQRSWENWLANMQFGGSGARSASARAKSSQKPISAVKEPLPAYLGEGRAELGDYSVRVFDPITQSSLRTDFRLEGQTHLGDEAAFKDFMGRNRRFFQEQVAVVLRTHNPDELASPDLSLLGRKIVARVNRTLGRRVLESVQVKDFALYESMESSGFALWDGGEAGGVP